jgi:glycosyltransferase involved in cell wall biosynthesis
MTVLQPLRVAVLVDLLRSPQAGGHVKCWERLAAAAAKSDLPLDLTVYFSGPEAEEILGPRTRLRELPPLLSTAKLRFLPYVPDHTDLAPYHWRLARELANYDVIHTTDGYFAFARTAERVSRAKRIPLVTSFHTDTPSYTRIFTRQTIEKLVGKNWLGRKLLRDWNIPEQQGQAMERRLARHVGLCRAALVTREEDHRLAENILGPARAHHLRLGVDKEMFGPHRADRTGIERDYAIPAGRIIILFVGRVDVGKNIYTLVDAIEKGIAQGLPLHLVTAGQGPAIGNVKRRLGAHASVPGFVPPEELARLYASVDGLALVSEVEIRSMAGVEAMASCCPVLVSRKSGVAELFEHTPAMREVESGIDNWAEALRAFATDAGARASMRTAALDYSRGNLATWHQVLAEDLLNVWREAALSARAANKPSEIVRPSAPEITVPAAQ